MNQWLSAIVIALIFIATMALVVRAGSPSLEAIGADPAQIVQRIRAALNQTADILDATAGDGTSVAKVDATGHFAQSQTRRPVIVSGCTTNNDAIVDGTDQAGVITTGLLPATSCTMSFVTPYGNKPTCVFGAADNASPSPAFDAINTTRYSAVVQFPRASARKLVYICMGH